MGTYGHVRGPVGTYGGPNFEPRGPLGPRGDLWGSMGAYWVPLAGMKTFGDLWEPLGTYWDLWGPLGTEWHLWGLMGTCGDL